jgi:hypothetical protein
VDVVVMKSVLAIAEAERIYMIILRIPLRA